ncbi:PREDICTED: uncharacterized protein LOC105557511 [Vollenhovia emeryi]|uniref:uncharacterized protein LOC105557511 n=1 Tax=Vollenhovia emeryi TaxID=411798 RepID=UPI0005F37B78|nr:PREDICTED: uncharacterized protein LOC105557511 [Vollenhovia emeryi]
MRQKAAQLTSLIPGRDQRSDLEGREVPTPRDKGGTHQANGFGSIWVQCRLEVAKKVAAATKIKVVWVAARVELLEARPLVCYKCLERGHVRRQCRSTVDRSALCYRCGQEGHKAQSCTAVPKCAVCSAKGLPANHKETPKEVATGIAGPLGDHSEPMEVDMAPPTQGAKKIAPQGGSSQEEAGNAAPSRR